MTIQLKATEQYFSVELFIMLYKVVLTFESVDEILKCDYLKCKLLSSTFLWYCLITDTDLHFDWSKTYCLLFLQTHRNLR